MLKRSIIFIVTVLLLFSSLLFALFVFKSKEDINPSQPKILPVVPKQSQKAETVISLSPNPFYIASQSGSFDVIVNTGSNKITAVQLEVGFDPEKITNVSLVPDVFFEQPVVLINDTDNKNGKISYALAIPPTGRAKSGIGVVAKINFLTKLSKGTKTDFVLLPKTLVTAEGQEASVLKKAFGATVIFSK